MGAVPEHEEEDLGWEWLQGDEEKMGKVKEVIGGIACLLYTSPSPRD